ncbi:MAG: pantoate--beta-alanine ligase [SAR202 cluster bacterium]|jgi:pantoate--beta-alanine ligase|nr:pantoate--beta-alanine ligase [SAR202 cluster bacterium]
MRVIETVDEFRAATSDIDRPLGLVPTMGALHDGHMSLVSRARAQSATLAVSIFVNPAQFGPTEDYASYPRDMEADYARLDEAGVDLVLAPTTDEMYPAGSHTRVDVGSLSERLEGASRPGHFVGVATVVTKLLSIVRPDAAYFGQKDAQQGLMICRLNADLNLGAQIVLCPIVREADGLALSSRNTGLTADERRAATVLYKALSAAGSMETDNAEQVRKRMREIIEEEPLAALDYVSVADPQTLDELDVMTGSALALVAVRIGKTRLIDNMAIGSKT